MKGKLSRLLLAAATVALASALAVPALAAADEAAGSSFADVEGTEWFAEDVEWANGEGLMTGTGDGTNFEPALGTTRAMFVTSLHRLEGKPAPEGADARVPEGRWYTDAALWALEAGVLKGYDDGGLGLGDVLTREQAALFAHRYAECKGFDLSEGEDTNILSYLDADRFGSWAVPAIQWACGEGIILGYTGADGELTGFWGPKDPANRAMAAAILHRLVDNVVIPGTPEPEPESPSAPAYPSHTHSYEWTSNDDGTHTEKCECNGERATQDCTFKGYVCTVCGYEGDTFYATPDMIEEVRSLIEADEGADGVKIFLADGDYLLNVKVKGGRSVSITGGKGAVVSGQIATTSSTAGTLTLKGVTVKVDDSIQDSTGISQTGKSAIAIWGNQKVVCEGVTFEMSLPDSTAITSWWDTGEGTTIVVRNCVFNCNGQRPIRATGNVTVEGCAFNDPYRYAVQLTAKASTATELDKAIINFNNNTIVNGENGKAFVYGIQLEGADYGCHDCVINGSGNKIENGGAESTMYYCECGKVDHSSILWSTEAAAVHEGANKSPITDAATLTDAINEGCTTLLLNSGVYDMQDVEAQGKTLTIIGSKDTVLKLNNDGEDGCDYSFGGSGGVGNITFEGLIIDTTENTGNYKGYAYMKGTFNDCNFVGAYSLNNANDFTFNRCTFDFKNGYFWTWGANSVTFDTCVFNGNSKCILAHGGASTVINIKDCTFAAAKKGYTGAGDNTAVVEIDPTGTNTYTISFTGENTMTDNYSGWTRVKDGSAGHVITGVQ